ncbi:MAG: S8 family serine peptidase [Planctomycetes bacterium]|nr:S8 family serine peptidase [Planctomycetota bacterium]
MALMGPNFRRLRVVVDPIDRAAAEEAELERSRDFTRVLLRLLGALALLVVLAVELSSWFLPSAQEIARRVQDATRSVHAVDPGPEGIVFVLDTFYGGRREHGDRMAEALLETCPEEVAIARLDLGHALESTTIERALAAVLDYATVHPELPIVVNMSFGGDGATPRERELIAQLATANVALVAAAGNEGTRVERFPAALPGVLAIGNASDFGRAASSSFGDWVDLYLDGYFHTTVASTAPQVTGGAATSFSIDSGTSFSAARASGLVAAVANGRRLASDALLPELLAAGAIERGGTLDATRVRWRTDESWRRRVYWRSGLAVAVLLALHWALKKRPEEAVAAAGGEDPAAEAPAVAPLADEGRRRA